MLIYRPILYLEQHGGTLSVRHSGRVPLCRLCQPPLHAQPDTRIKICTRHWWDNATYISQGEDKETTDECSLQVSLMKEIYNDAAEVVVWLGKPRDPKSSPAGEQDSGRLFAALQENSKQCNSVVEKGGPAPVSAYDSGAGSRGDVSPVSVPQNRQDPLRRIRNYDI